MSRAFVKEEGGERWVPPVKAAAYRVWVDAPGGPEAVHESEDLLGALHWLETRPHGGFELRTREGRLLAVK